MVGRGRSAPLTGDRWRHG